MTDFIRRGKLKVEGSKISFFGRPTPKKPDRWLDIPVKFCRDHDIAQLDGVEVEVTFRNGGVGGLRMLGSALVAAMPLAAMVPARATMTATSVEPPSFDGAGFVLAYNFIPRTKRTTEADGTSAPHSVYDSQRYSGTIPITIVARTPLVTPDQSRTQTINRGHKVGVLLPRMDPKNRPILLGTSIKGMIRSHFEAVTSSRFGSFSSHQQLLAARQRPEVAGENPFSTGVVTEVLESGGRRVTALLKLAPIGCVQRVPVTQIWINKNDFGDSAYYASGRPEAQQVTVWIQYYDHLKGFGYWNAVSGTMKPATADMAPRPQPLPGTRKHITTGVLVQVKGWLHWTGSQFDSGESAKYNERLAVTEILGGDPIEVDIQDDILLPAARVAEWDYVLTSFRTVTGRGQPATDRLGSYARPLGRGQRDEWAGLPVGRTLHLKVTSDGNDPVGERPRPALIGRDTFELTPRELAQADDLVPTTDPNRLSAAERVFGWVSPVREDLSSEAGVRGHLRIDTCIGDRPTKGFTHPILLATLNGPKPSQYRFYLRDSEGEPLGSNGPMGPVPFQAEEGYREGQLLAGQKVYLYDRHLLDPEASKRYWEPPGALANGDQPGRDEAVAVGSGATRYREYLGTSVRPNVSQMLQRWTPSGTVFRTTIHVDNLARGELAALLWLLHLPDSPDRAQGHLRLGLGKALGFGVVRVEVDSEGEANLSTGDQLAASYRGFSDPRGLTRDEIQELVAEFDEQLEAKDSELRLAVLIAAWGETEAPVHAPRPTERPSTENPQVRDELFRWWVSNEKGGRRGLPSIIGKDRRLPYSP